MLRRADAPSPQSAHEPDSAGRPAPPRPGRRPPGPLDALLETGPGFPVTLRGYDRMQVDNYVAWAEAELHTVRRGADDLMARYGRACAELELSQRLLARSPEGREMTHLSERIGSMLRLAADEAAEITAVAREEADRTVAEARADADARLRKASEIKQLAMAAGDRFREESRRLRDQAAAELEGARAQAAAELERARAGAAELARTIEQEARKQAADAASAAAAQLAQLQEEVADLHRQRTAARESLDRLTEQIDGALQALSGDGALQALPGSAPGPVEHVFVGNTAVG